MISKTLFRDVQTRVAALAATLPGLVPFISIRRQLAYLLETRTVRMMEVGSLKVNLGLIAVREVEPLDLATAEILYKVAGPVRAMRGETGWPK